VIGKSPVRLDRKASREKEKGRMKKKYSNGKRHWGEDTFVVMKRADGCRYGYCSVCNADMQYLPSLGLHHYNSHKNYKLTSGW